MRIRDRVDRWLISSKASTFNRSTLSDVVWSWKRCSHTPRQTAPGILFHARSIGCALISPNGFLQGHFCTLWFAFVALANSDDWGTSLKIPSKSLVRFIVFRVKQPVFQPSNQPFKLYFHLKPTKTDVNQVPIHEAIPKAILNLYSRLSITVTSPVILARDFLRPTTDNHQLNRLSLIKLTPWKSQGVTPCNMSSSNRRLKENYPVTSKSHTYLSQSLHAYRTHH